MKMNEWIEVNGAKIERAYFEENVREANNYEWECLEPPELPNHVHCMICNIAIGGLKMSEELIYKSKGGWLCDNCHDQYVKK